MDEERLLRREQTRRKELEERAELEMEHRAARKRIAATTEPIARGMRDGRRALKRSVLPKH